MSELSRMIIFYYKPFSESLQHWVSPYLYQEKWNNGERVKTRNKTWETGVVLPSPQLGTIRMRSFPGSLTSFLHSPCFSGVCQLHAHHTLLSCFVPNTTLGVAAPSVCCFGSSNLQACPRNHTQSLLLPFFGFFFGLFFCFVPKDKLKSHFVLRI